MKSYSYFVTSTQTTTANQTFTYRLTPLSGLTNVNLILTAVNTTSARYVKFYDNSTTVQYVTSLTDTLYNAIFDITVFPTLTSGTLYTHSISALKTNMNIDTFVFNIPVSAANLSNSYGGIKISNTFTYSLSEDNNISFISLETQNPRQIANVAIPFTKT